MHEKLIGRRCCFYIDGIQNCKIVFNLHIQNFRYKMLFFMLKFCLISKYSNRVLLLRILFLQIYPVCAIKKKQKELLIVYRSKQKSSTHDQVLVSSREHQRVLLCCSTQTFKLLYSSSFLKFANDFEISCQIDGFTIKVEFTL